MAGIKWTELENKTLEKIYANYSNKCIIENLPNRSWEAIKIQASKRGIVRSFDAEGNNSKLADITLLLEDNYNSYYWIGFLLADGHFYKNKKRFTLTLSIKDLDHVRKFSKYIKYNGNIKIKCVKEKYKSARISCMDVKRVSLIMDKFNIKSNKTYYPPDIESYTKNSDLLLSLIIGFIDGDGNISRQSKRKDSFIRIKCHKSWFENLEFISKFVSSLAGYRHKECKINKEGYATMCISNFEIVRFLKLKVKELKLPVLNRKWELIDENLKRERISKKCKI